MISRAPFVAIALLLGACAATDRETELAAAATLEQFGEAAADADTDRLTSMLSGEALGAFARIRDAALYDDKEILLVEADRSKEGRSLDELPGGDMFLASVLYCRLTFTPESLEHADAKEVAARLIEDELIIPRSLIPSLAHFWAHKIKEKPGSSEVLKTNGWIVREGGVWKVGIPLLLSFGVAVHDEDYVQTLIVEGQRATIEAYWSRLGPFRYELATGGVVACAADQPCELPAAPAPDQVAMRRAEIVAGRRFADAQWRPLATSSKSERQ